MQKPKVIFLDAVGTLFSVKGSVGKIYAETASRFGVEVSASDLDKAFYKSFKESTPMAFPGGDPQELAAKELEWWKILVTRSFQIAGVIENFADFTSFFEALYAQFATSEPWFIYPDVLPTLKEWQKLGIELGVVSNFDSRIYSVLSALNLSEFFTSITISTEVGAAKPEPEIFFRGLEKHNCPSEAAWHIGDSYKEDYQGAKAAGLKAIWLNRS